MSANGLGRVKTKSDLVVMSSGRQIFAFFCSPHDRRAQNSGCDYTPQSFYTARVIFGSRPSSSTRLLRPQEQTNNGHRVTVSVGPIASFCPVANKPSFDQFVGYSITLLASTRNDSGIVSPIALAVLRLITSSKFV